MSASHITVPQVADMLNKLVRERMWGSVQVELKNGKLTCIRKIETFSNLQDESHQLGDGPAPTYHEQHTTR